MAKVYAKDIHDKDTVKTVFVVARKTPTTAKNGKPFLALVLRDKTGEIDARVWERVEELDPVFTKGDYIEVEGSATTFQGRPQLKVDNVVKVDPAGLDASDFVAPPKAEPGERFMGAIGEILEHLHDPHVKALCKSFLADPAMMADFRRAPAAKTIHHAHHGGLAEHTLSVMRLAQRVSDQYPMADRDLLVAGAFLHDLGKLRELGFERQTEYTDEGRLVGHLVIAAEWIHDHASRIEGFPKPLEAHLKHLVLSHHGSMEFGSPRLPQTLEAMLLHYIDELDSRVSSWLEVMRRDPGETWTDFQKLYDRHLYKGAAPTANGKAPVERRHRKERQENREKDGKEAKEKGPRQPKPEGEKQEAAPSERPPREKHERTDRPERHEGEQRERKERGPKKPEEKLTFKPFAALVSDAPPEVAPAAEAPAPAEVPAEAAAPVPAGTEEQPKS